MNIIFKHVLIGSFFECPSIEITILDNPKDNVVIGDTTYTIPYESINTIKKLLNNPELYKRRDLIYNNILDGTTHEITFSNGNKTKELYSFNMWYWNEKGAYDKIDKKYSEKDIKYTKLVMNLINTIQSILTKNRINFNILNPELYDDYDEDDF